MKNECESYTETANGIKSIVSGSVFCVGDCVKAFNSKEWEKKGDIGDNEQFYREAEIVKLRKESSMVYADRWWLADVKWKHNGEISNGHFVRGLKHCH